MCGGGIGRRAGVQDINYAFHEEAKLEFRLL